MINRSKHITIYSLLIGILFLSIGFNFMFYHRLVILQEFIKTTNPWVTNSELNLIEQEINRLENTKYQIFKGE